MRTLLGLLLLASPAVAQTKAIDDTVQTVLFVKRLQDPETGAYKVTPDGKPSLRACNGGVKALKYLLDTKAAIRNEKLTTFVLGCYDPATGAFAEPGGKPDVAISSVGVMVACELGVPHDRMPKAMAYLKANAKTFEEVRIAAAAVEAWGVTECGFDVGPWLKVAADEVRTAVTADANADHARLVGSVVAMSLRLGQSKPAQQDARKILLAGQRPDGGWGKPGVKESDIETTYRVMRAFRLLNEKPNDVAAVRTFLASHRNADGGYATRPGEASSMSGVYYAAIIGRWAK